MVNIKKLNVPWDVVKLISLENITTLTLTTFDSYLNVPMNIEKLKVRGENEGLISIMSVIITIDSDSWFNIKNV